MKGFQKTTLSVLSVIACSVWLILLYLASQAVQAWSGQLLGPTLAYPTQLQLPATWTASPVVSTAAAQPTITLVPTLTFETQTPVPPFIACN